MITSTKLWSLSTSLLLLGSSAMAAPTDLQPTIQFTTGLTGSQSRLSWPAVPGARYRIQSCTDLSEAGGTGAWQARAMVVPTATDGTWLDPAPAGNRVFYKIDPPEPEVFSVSPAVIATGSTLIIKAQCLPADCSIVFDFGGIPPVSISAPLVPDGPGQYRAVFANTPPTGEQWAKSARIVDAHGGAVVMIGQTFEITQSGFASNSPPTPPAVTKKMHGAPKIGEATAVFQSLPGEVCLQECDLSVAVPAGPPLELVRTYRSLEHGGSGTAGSHWEQCYDVRIEPMPAGSGVNATCILLHTGDGRRDVLLRQADGSFSADGMFRSGAFKPDTSFELTLADHAKLIFCPLVGAPWRGRIGSIEDRNGVALTCSYSAAGKLITVSSQFGQSLTFDYDAAGKLFTVTDQTGRFVSYNYYAIGETGGNPGDLKTVSCPTLPGQAAIQGPTTFTYTTGFTDARRNGQLLEVHDGAGRLACAYTYSTSSNDTDADFARCVSMDCNRVLPTDAPTTFSYAFLPPASGFAGGLRCTMNDEVGRVMECDFDKQWRCVRTAELTGFATPGVPVTATTNRPPVSSKLRNTDPEQYVTTCEYNADHCCTVCTEADGLQTIMTYARDLNRSCPVLERGNTSVTTLRSPFGEERTVACDFLAGFGTGEGMNCGMKKFDWAPKLEGGKEGLASAKASDGKKHFEVCGKLTKADAGFWGDAASAGVTPKLPPPIPSHGPEKWEGILSARPRKGGVVNGSITVVNGSACKPGAPVQGPVVECDGKPSGDAVARGIAHWGNRLENLEGGIAAFDDWEAPVVRLTTSLGQVFTWGYDGHGNCTARTAPAGGGTCIRNPFGQVTRMTTDNGTTPLVTEINYDPVTKFCASVVQDPGGLQLTVSCERDSLRRINRVVNERGDDALITYNACDQPTSVSSPAVGTDSLSTARITCTQFYDAGGLPVRCDLEHRDAAGALVTSNPAYSGFCLYDNRGRLTGRASEQKPVDFPPTTLVPTPAQLASCDVCYYLLNAAGECIRASKPAASTGQTMDMVCDYRYDERGLIFRCIEGGLGTADAVTTERDYNYCGQTTHFRTLATAPLVSPTISCSYDGFRRPQSCVDEMGNVTEFSYDNKGYVTCSVSGEEVDVPGGTGNVLLAAMRTNQPIVTKDVDNITQSAMRSNQPIVTKDVADISEGRRPTPKIMEEHLGMFRIAGGSAPKVNLKKCVGRKLAARVGGGSAFFDYETNDVICIEERFTPGQTTPHALETTTQHYSPAGLLLSETCNSDTLSTFGYDTAGRLTTCTKPGVASTVCTLDAAGNPTVCVVTAFSTIQGVAAETFTTTRSYDSLCRQVSYSDSLSNTTTCNFDSLCRITRCSQPGGLVSICEFDTLSATTGTFSSRTLTQQTSTGQIISTCRCVCLGGFCSSATDALDFTTSYVYDTQGRCVLTSYPDGTTEGCSFNELGHPFSQTRKNGAILSADFDRKGRCVSGVCSNLPADVVPVPATSLVYSGLGDCVQLTEGSSVISRIFDSCGNEVSETQDGHSVTRTFSHRGRIGIAYPTGERFSETRNAQGQLLAVSSVTATGQVLLPAISALEYQGLNCVKETRANGIVTTYDYRSDGEAVNSPNIISGITLVPDYSFGSCVRTTVRNNLGNTVEVAVTRRNADQFATQTVNLYGAYARVHDFTLDARNLVTGSLARFRVAATAPLVTESEVTYLLDARGQRLSTSGGSRPGPYFSDASLPPADAQMEQYSKWPGGQLTWDDEGCLRRLNRNTTALELIYDACSRLVEVQDGSGTPLASYTYDACDRRISRTLPGTAGTPPATTRFLYDGETCIQETDGSNVPQRTYACATGSAICIVPITGNPIYPHGTGTNINTTESNLKDIPPAACMGDSSSSARLKVWQLMQGQSGSQAMRWTPLVPKPKEPLRYGLVITSSLGDVTERVDCDDAGQPIFLNEVGAVRAGATSTLSNYHWIKPAYDAPRIWCPETGFFQCDNGVYSPELGQPIAYYKEKPKPATKPAGSKELTGTVSLLR